MFDLATFWAVRPGPSASTRVRAPARTPPLEATPAAAWPGGGPVSPLRTTNRSIAMLGAAGALAGPAAIALADEPTEATADAATLRAAIGDEPTVRAEMRGHLHDRLLRRHK